jgi:hypothetical protein
MVPILQLFRAAAALMLLIALAPMANEYYAVLRIVVFVAALIEVIQTARAKLSLGTMAFWMLAFLAVAVAFNPIQVLAVSRQAWIYFDLFSVALFGLVMIFDHHPRAGKS